MKSFNDSYAEREEVFQPKFEELVKLIKKSRNMTVFTGAGVSTLSGIPDFRGKHGVYNDPWQGMDVEEIKQAVAEEYIIHDVKARKASDFLVENAVATDKPEEPAEEEKPAAEAETPAEEEAPAEETAEAKPEE